MKMTFHSNEFDIGLGVTRLQLRNNLTVAEFADRLGTSRMQIYRFKDSVDIKFSVLCQMADAFDMPVESVLELCRV
jgi:hypothetical protein